MADFLRAKETEFGCTNQVIKQWMSIFSLKLLKDYPESPLIPEFMRKKIRSEVLSKTGDASLISELYNYLTSYYLEEHDIRRASLCSQRSEIIIPDEDQKLPSSSETVTKDSQ